MLHKNHYREKLLEEIQTIPQEMTPVLYKIVHLLNVQWLRKKDVKRRTKKRGSLKGIWKGSKIDKELFIEARESLFSYEDR